MSHGLMVVGTCVCSFFRGWQRGQSAEGSGVTFMATLGLPGKLGVFLPKKTAPPCALVPLCPCALVPCPALPPPPPRPAYIQALTPLDPFSVLPRPALPPPLPPPAAKVPAWFSKAIP